LSRWITSETQRKIIIIAKSEGIDITPKNRGTPSKAR
jgi:hypothetical protein